MAGNTDPIYSRVGDIQWGATALTTANTAVDGTGTVLTVWTADATNGGRLEKVVARALGTNVATVLRLFINNGSSTTTAANNILYTERTLPATTVSQVAELLDQTISFAVALPPGYKITATIGTTVAAGYALAGIGGKY